MKAQPVNTQELPKGITDYMKPGYTVTDFCNAFLPYYLRCIADARNAACLDASNVVAAAQFVLSVGLDGTPPGVMELLDAFMGALPGRPVPGSKQLVNVDELRRAWRMLGEAFPPETILGVHPDGAHAGEVSMGRAWDGSTLVGVSWQAVFGAERAVCFNVEVQTIKSGRLRAVATVASPLCGALVKDGGGVRRLGDNDVIKYDGDDALALLGDAAKIIDDLMGAALESGVSPWWGDGE